MQVAAVRNIKTKYTANVNATAPRVPRGIDLPGSFSSPDMFAPAIMPVTPLKRTFRKDEKAELRKEKSNRSNNRDISNVSNLKSVLLRRLLTAKNDRKSRGIVGRVINSPRS